MNSSTLRRLASDHSALHKNDLPPHYLFPPSGFSSSIPDDLTQLTILLTGPQGTPYSQGLWKLCLKIPEDYPKSPPKAAFRTRIWHPNVEETTGSVCVDTLKKDWESKLTLRDVLITISCLLIQPNPDSALNATAGHLLQDDYESFARQARLMTSIHACIPSELKEAVLEAKGRGEAAGTQIREEIIQRPVMIAKSASSSSVVMKKLPHLALAKAAGARRIQSVPTTRVPAQHNAKDSAVDEDDEATGSKENDPSLSPSPVNTPQSPRRPLLAKRPLSDLPTPVEPDSDCDDAPGISPSERNIANNTAQFLLPSLSTPNLASPSTDQYPCKFSTLTERSRIVNFTSRGLQDAGTDGLAIVPFEDIIGSNDDDVAPAAKRVCSGEGKENVTEALSNENKLAATSSMGPSRSVTVSVAGASKPSSGALRKGYTVAGNMSNGAPKGRPRIGLRRL